MNEHATTLSALRAGHLARAARLDLRGLALADFPREIFDLAETLEYLDLSDNALRSLPADLPRLRRLRVLFCSGNRFTGLPAALGRCASLDIVGFKANQIEHVPAESLPEGLRWLILTDNRIAALPSSLARCTRLRKLMLASNRLRAWPVGIDACASLELVRIAANLFESPDEALPPPLLALPQLAWLAFAGNPFCAAREAQAVDAAPVPGIRWADLRIGALLGEGASGRIFAADWAPAGPVAVKLFKGTVTSDGLPLSEMAACIAAGSHPNLVGVLGRLAGHPQGVQGLVMPRIPAGFRNLAGPPSLATCTRDVYPEAWRPRAREARAIAQGVGAALEHLHARGLLHGDLYAHNLLVDAASTSRLGDFGAASFMPDGDAARAAALRRIDRRALAVLVDELASRCDEPDASDGLPGR